MSSIMLGQGSFPFLLFPTWAPRHLVVSPSLRIVMMLGMVGGLLVWRVQEEATLDLYSADPTGMTTVFSLLNLAPDCQGMSQLCLHSN